MAKRVKNAVVKVGSYQDRNTGETKGSFKSVGSLMRNDDGTHFLILDRTFNPAGVADPQGRGSIIINLWDDREDSTPGGARGAGAGQSGGQSGGGRSQLDDEIPF